MFFYRYDVNYNIIEKSNEPIAGDDICKSELDFDLNLYNIVIGLLDTDKNITYHTEKARPAIELVRYIEDLRENLTYTQAQLTQTTATLDTVLTEFIPKIMEW